MANPTTVNSTGGYGKTTITALSGAQRWITSFKFTGNAPTGEFIIAGPHGYVNGGTTRYQIFVYPANDGTKPNQVTLFYRNSGGTGIELSLGTKVNDTWYHICWRIDGSGNGFIYALLEGFNAASPSYLATASLGAVQAGSDRVAHWIQGTNDAHQTQECFIGNSLVTSGDVAEATALEQFAHRFPIEYPVDRFFYDCDAVSGVLTDLSGNGADATLTNSSSFTTTADEPSEWQVTTSIRMGSMVARDSSTATSDHTASLSLEVYGQTKRTLVVKLAYFAVSTGVTAATFDGNAMTLAIKRDATIGSLGGVAIYYYDIPDGTSAGTYTVSVTVDGTLGTVSIIDAHVLYNAQPGGPEATGSADNTSTSITASITTITAGAWVEDALINQTSADDGTPGTGQYELADAADGAGTHRGCSSWIRKDTAGATDTSWSAITTATGHILVNAAFKPFSAATAPSGRRLLLGVGF